MKNIILLIVSISLFSSISFSQNTYTLDKPHARLSFSAYHLGISFVDGIFKNFDATFISSKEDFTDAQIELNADINSISTEVEMRDKDLRDNWFETAKFPKLNFKSTYKLNGNITIHGVTKPITFNVVFNGKAQSPFTKKYSYGFTITGKLNRNDFGIGNESVPTVGKEIKLWSNVEFIIN